MTGPSPELARAAREAVERFGSPLYLYDLPRLDADARAVRAALPADWLALYSLKANGLPALLKRVVAAGFGASCVSGSELDLAADAGVGREQTALEGIGKSEPNLERAARLSPRARRCSGSASSRWKRRRRWRRMWPRWTRASMCSSG